MTGIVGAALLVPGLASAQTTTPPATPAAPTGVPTGLPSGVPTGLPSGVPTGLPSGVPTGLPSGLPTGLPSLPIPTGLPSQGGTATTEPLSTYQAPDYGSYFSGPVNIYNCGDLDFNTAQVILAMDSSDPNRLDGDNDGTACDNNGKNHASYSGYPQGGVATGDSPVAPDQADAGAGALALVLTAGLAAAGTARRRERTDEVAGV